MRNQTTSGEHTCLEHSRKSRTTSGEHSRTIILVTIMVLCLSTAVQAKYSGGTGEPNDPYLIATAEDMNAIGANPADWDKHFLLVNDVNLAQYTGTQFKIIGNSTTKFTGVFDGNHYKIWNFTWSSTSRNYIGLFGYVGEGGQIKNLGMENVDVNAVNRSYVGGLVGYNHGLISNCYSTGSVSGNTDVGGLVGNNTFGTISNCYANGSVSGNKCVGELVGINYGTILDCHANGSVTGDELVGGLVGFNNETVSNCYATGSVSEDNEAGGLVGGNYGTILDCYANGSVAGNELVGGLVGVNGGTISNCYAAGAIDGNENTGGLVGGNAGMISNSYATGSITGNDNVGGLVGFNPFGTIMNCYANGSVTGDELVGGLVGAGGGVINSFWDVETSGQLESAVGHGKTTDEMKMASTYLNWGGCGNYGVWTIDEGNDYPHLAWEGKPGQLISEQQLSGYVPGSGTESDPYLISTAQQLNLIGLFPYEWDKNFALVADINMADYNGTQFNIIGGPGRPFTGVFDGKDHKIWNFTWDSNGVSYIGLFGYVGTGGQIKNLGMEDVDVNTENSSFVGGLVGGNYGTILDCYANGSVAGDELVGGLVGVNGGTISNCYAAGAIDGNENTGGLVGENWSGTISDCYAKGSVTETGMYARYIGGLVGGNYSTITNCYATGSVLGTGDYSHSIGGLVGGNAGMISNSYATGSITGNDDVGGLVGENYEGSISNSYATGAVDGSACLGGLVGDNLMGTITNCYSTSSVTGEYDVVGGLVGFNWDGSVFGSFWDVNTSGQTRSAGGTPKTTAEMKTRSTFTDSGWDFVGETINGPNDYWRMCVDDVNYPLLSWQFAPDFVCPDGVDILDLAFLVERWLAECNEANNFCNCTDINHDGSVNFYDFAILANHWLIDYSLTPPPAMPYRP